MRRNGQTVIVVTHRPQLLTITTKMVVMRNGEVVEQGETVSVIRTPAQAYTRDLVAALPPPDPTIDWGLERSS
jgi:ABC-type glutathione transport system ATPase component